MSALSETAAAPAPLAVRLTGVSKAYPLLGPGGKWNWLPWAKKTEPAPDFYALKNIDLQIPAGRSLGILGMNGAGKSTLLSLVAGNIRPTSGQLEVNGHVQLLQLGAGFTPELTARQNVVAHARARGLSKEEIEQRVAYVQEFADIGPFFDQPMQNYSSGMRGRVAFGNAFAIDPEILIVDEALAVGDAVFVNKCFRRLFEARERGTTLLYTSHSTDSIVRLCEEGIVLHKGEMVASGSAKTAAAAYLKLIHGSYSDDNSENLEDMPSAAIALPAAPESAKPLEIANLDGFSFKESDNVDRAKRCILYNKDENILGGGGARIVDCAFFRNGKAGHSRLVSVEDTIDLFARVFFDRDMDAPNIGFVLNSRSGECFYGTNQQWRGDPLIAAKKGESRQYHFRFSALVAPGDWFIEFAIADHLTPVQKRVAMLHLSVEATRQKSVGPGWINLDITPIQNPLNTKRLQK